MSIRQGDNIIAGKVQVDETPTLGSTRPVSSDGVYRTCANRDADNFTDTGTTFLSRQGMPSNRRDQLTLLASGTEYTAPANGWWHFTGQLGAGGGTSNQILMYARDFIEGNNLTARILAPSVMASYPAILPARAGSKLVLNYASTSTTPNWLFFFHYADGDKSNE